MNNLECKISVCAGNHYPVIEFLFGKNQNAHSTGGRSIKKLDNRPPAKQQLVTCKMIFWNRSLKIEGHEAAEYTLGPETKEQAAGIKGAYRLCSRNLHGHFHTTQVRRTSIFKLCYTNNLH